MSLQVFDYLIAGAGAAGCALAARLAEDPRVSVGLVEQGSARGQPLGRVPLASGTLAHDPRYAKRFVSDRQPETQLLAAQGLGGGSLLGEGLWHLAQAPDLERWAKLSDHWNPRALLAAYQRAESARHQEEPRGRNGAVKLARAGQFDDLTQAFVRAAHRSGLPIVSDLSLTAGAGVGRADVMVAKGRKQTSASAYLSPMPPNVTLLTNSKVQRVQFLGRRAVGLEVTREGGWQTSFQARREVILSAGALITPQILLLSGIGPGLTLRRFDIPVMESLAGVGQGLFDQPQISLSFAVTDQGLGLGAGLRPDRAWWQSLLYATRREGLAAGTLWSATATQALPDGGSARVDFAPFALREASAESSLLGRISTALRPGRWLFGPDQRAEPGFSLRVTLGEPSGRGQVSLSAPNPDVVPAVSLEMLREEADLEAMSQALAAVRGFVEHEPLSGLTAGQVAGPMRDTAAASDLRQAVEPAHHYAATCRMGHGDDELSVLDPELRVRGVEGLRVVDASAFPDGLSVPPLATVIMLAERAAALIRHAWR